MNLTPKDDAKGRGLGLKSGEDRQHRLLGHLNPIEMGTYAMPMMNEKAHRRATWTGDVVHKTPCSLPSSDLDFRQRAFEFHVFVSRGGQQVRHFYDPP